MISVSQVSKYYGSTKAVDDVSFKVAKGENLILLGTSGCGKTTTLRLINRLIDVTGGNIAINGTDIINQPVEYLRRNIGYVLQHNSLFPHYTVAENIATVPQLLKWDRKKTELRTQELIDKLHLSGDYLTAYPDRLSGGQQQRVNIARALAADPPVLLMDEPFGALDPITRINIRKEFKGLDELRQKTIIMVTHDVQEAFELGDRICLMDKGRIVQIGTPIDLLLHPVNDFARDFLSETYLQLLFKIISVADVWNYLPMNEAGTNVTEYLPINVSLWQAMEKINGLNNQLQIAVKKDDQIKRITLNSLMSAFETYKAKM